jgi:4a-hydroxytetrahydrobiopterin dehydratase
MSAPKETGDYDDNAPAPVLNAEDVAEQLSQLLGWSIDNAQLVKPFHFPVHRDATRFVKRVAETADARNHHPFVHWWKRDVRIELYTRKSKGLTLRDFEFAACCDQLLKEVTT